MNLRHVATAPPRRRTALALCLALGWLAFAGPPLWGVGPAEAWAQSRPRGRLDAFRKLHHEAHLRFASALEDIAAFCDEKRLPEAAALVRESAKRPDLHAVELEPLPTDVQPEIPLSLPDDERAWKTRLRVEREKYAHDLYLLSRRALRAGFPSYAYLLVREVARNDLDHRAARRLLGFERYGDEWVTPFAASKLRQNEVWHDTFGWLPKGHVERYEEGQRSFRGRWISAAKEAAIRQDFRHAWEIRTDHYLIKTNHSHERAVEVAVALEQFHRFFRHTFAAYFDTPEQLQKLFEGSAVGRRAQQVVRPYVVHYYRNKPEYVAELDREYPQIAMTNGLYDPDDRIVYSFHDEQGNSISTLFHEATHQLLAENRLADWPIAEHANFWIVEGIACYMESFRHAGGRASIGDPRFERFNAARYYLLAEKYYVPLEAFSRMGKQSFQKDPQITANYCQASGLAYFLMEFAEGAYRDAMIEHIRQIYHQDPRRRMRVQSLEELTGVSLHELDEQYAEYTREIQDLVAPGQGFATPASP